MIVRFVSNVLVVIAGALLAGIAFAVDSDLLGWLAFGVGCGALLVVLAAFPVRGRGTLQRVLDLVAMLVAAWTIVASRSFGGSALSWWTLCEGAALFTLGIAGLLSGELEVRAALRRLLSSPAARPATHGGGA